MKQILILAESDDLAALDVLPVAEYDAVLLAFWASPEFVARLERHGARTCWRLNDLVADYNALVARAYALAHQVADAAPAYRGVNALRAWENIIANALLIPMVMDVLHRALGERLEPTASCAFLTHSDTQRAFEAINRHSARSFATRVLNGHETTKAHAPGGRLGAMRRLAAEVRRAGDWSNLFWVPVETVDSAYKLRARMSGKTRAARGGDLFYSSYVNYSRVLAAHAGSLSAPPQWVVNLHAARRGLPPGVQAFNLWQFGASRPREHAEALAGITDAVASAAESADGFPLRAALVGSQEVQEAVSRVIPLLLAEIDLEHNCLEQVRPDMLWVANQWGSEGCILQAAHALDIPVTQVQHGGLEQYYSCAPIYTERFLVWNEFWRQVVNPAYQSAVSILEPAPVAHTPTSASDWNGGSGSRVREHGAVTFFTNPPEAVPLWNPSVVRWETVTLLRELTGRGQAVTLRAHPMDGLDQYAGVWRNNYGALPKNLALDKGTPLEPLLARTNVALMVFSTVVMDCIARGIPVVGLGWYDFMFKAQVERARYVGYEDTIQRTVERCAS